MSNLLKAEFFKLSHSKSFWGLLIISLILSSVLLLDSISETNSFLNASLYNTSLLCFLVIILSALFVGEDFAQRTLHCYVCSGHKRSSILFAKVFVYIIACISILGIPLLIYGLSDALVKNPVDFSGQELGIALAVVFVAIVAVCMVPLFCAVMFKDTGKSLAVPMVLFFLMIFALNGEHALQMAVIFPIGQLRLLALNKLTVSAGTILLIDAAWIVVLYIGSYFAFARADLK